MGSIGGMLGLGGGAGGSGFAGQKEGTILNPATTAQANTLYDQNQAALAQQQSFLQAVQQQNGLGNQSSVFNQLQGVANGTGPNPAQAQLAQATGANVANQAALMAGQRGSSANVGLMGRQAAMQGANTQQQAAGQAASLQAQQSLGALNSMGSMANQQANQQAAATGAYTNAVQGEQGQVLNAIGNQNNANVGMQSNMNSNNAGMANTRMGQQANMVGNIAGGIGSTIAGLFAEGGAVQPGGQYAPVVGDPFAAQGAIQNGPVAVAVPPPPTAPQQSMADKAAQGPKSNIGKFLHGILDTPAAATNGKDALGNGSLKLGKAIGGLFGGHSGSATDMSDEQVMQDRASADAMLMTPGVSTEQDMQAKLDPSTMMAAEGGKVPAMVSPGEKYLKPQDVQKVKAGANPMEVGETIPGKPKVGGAKNDYANDTVPKTLESGGLVLPRSVTQSKHPHWEAMKFVKAHMAKGGFIPPAPKSKNKKGK